MISAFTSTEVMVRADINTTLFHVLNCHSIIASLCYFTQAPSAWGLEPSCVRFEWTPFRPQYNSRQIYACEPAHTSGPHERSTTEARQNNSRMGTSNTSPTNPTGPPRDSRTKATDTTTSRPLPSSRHDCSSHAARLSKRIMPRKSPDSKPETSE